MPSPPLYRSLTVSGNTSAANVTAVEPAGAALNDILIAWLYIEGAAVVTPPSGWTNTFNGTAALAQCVLPGSAFRLLGYWIRRGAGAPDLTWVFTNSFRFIAVAAYSAALTSGDPFSFCTPAVRDTTASRTFPAVSGDTTQPYELLSWSGTGFSCGNTGTQPVGFTEREDSATAHFEIADRNGAAPGPNGPFDGASYGVGSSTDTTAVIFVGIKPIPDAAPVGVPGAWLTA